MTINELQGLLAVGGSPITIDAKCSYNGIYQLVRITNNQKVFLDFENDLNSSGGLRMVHLTLHVVNVKKCIRAL